MTFASVLLGAAVVVKGGRLRGSSATKWEGHEDEEVARCSALPAAAAGKRCDSGVASVCRNTMAAASKMAHAAMSLLPDRAGGMSAPQCGALFTADF